MQTAQNDRTTYEPHTVSRLFSHVRGLVKREGAEQYVLYSLLSFAVSVGLTRLFLEVMGYPQLGNQTLHIAHVLWGGLLLFVASLLPLVLANRWVYTVGGLLSGAGVGLFIDEVGKFITQTNDYFYPPAAPIIYAFFLLVVLLYLRVRRPAHRNARAELYAALDGLQEVLDHDLDQHERAALIGRLHYVIRHAESTNHVALAPSLLDFVTTETLELVPRRLSLEERIERGLETLLDRHLGRRGLRLLLILGLGAMGLAALGELTILLPNAPSLEQIYTSLLGDSDQLSRQQIVLYFVRLGLEAGVGVLLLAGAGLLFWGRERWGTLAAYFGLLIALTVLDVLVFYFDQFSTIVLATLQFGLLLALLIYRQRYMAPAKESEDSIARR